MNYLNPNPSFSDPEEDGVHWTDADTDSEDEEMDCSAIDGISDSDCDAEDIDWAAMCGQEGAEEVDWAAFYGEEVADEDWPATLAQHGLHFKPTPRILIRQFLRVKILGKIHRMPPHLRCHLVNLSAPDLSSLEYDPHLNLNYYFCVRAEALTMASGSWRMVSGPVLVERRGGSVCGSFSVFQLMNSNVMVKEYRSTELDQPEVN